MKLTKVVARCEMCGATEMMAATRWSEKKVNGAWKVTAQWGMCDGCRRAEARKQQKVLALGVS